MTDISKHLPGINNIHRFVLPNGIILLCMHNPHSPSIYVAGLIEASSKFDPVEKLGLADFTASMLLRGTQQRDFNQIHNLLESSGANLSFSASAQNTWFSGRSLSEDLETMLALIADSLMFPSFPEEYVERMRNQILTSLAIREQDTGDMASLNFDQILFPGHPYGQPVDGFPKTIQAIMREDLINFHAQICNPKGMLIAIVGGVEPQVIFDQVVEHLGKWETTSEPKSIFLPPIRPLEKTVRKHIEIAEKSQTDFIMGSLGPSRSTKDYLLIHIGNNILGQFGMMGRIGEAVRVQAGLAYYATSSVNSWSDAGTWEFSAGVNPSNTEKAIKMLQQEIRKYLEMPVTDEELNNSKSHLIGRLTLSLESNAGLANAILAMEKFGLGLDYYQRYPDLVNEVSAEDIMEVSRRFLDAEKLVIVSAGTKRKGNQ